MGIQVNACACGNTEVVFDNSGSTIAVSCPNCGCRGPWGPAAQPDVARKKWNESWGVKPPVHTDLFGSQECVDLTIALNGVNECRLFRSSNKGSLQEECERLLHIEETARALVERIKNEHEKGERVKEKAAVEATVLRVHLLGDVIQGKLEETCVDKREIGRFLDQLIERHCSGTDLWTDLEAELDRLGFVVRPKDLPATPLTGGQLLTANLTKVEEDILLHMLSNGGRGYLSPSVSVTHLASLGFIESKGALGWIFAHPAVIDRAINIRRLREEEEERPAGYYDTVKLTTDEEDILLHVLVNGGSGISVVCPPRDLVEAKGFIVPHGPSWKFSCESAMRRALRIRAFRDGVGKP